MIWAQWAIVGVAVVGAFVLAFSALHLWRQVKSFARMLGRASETLASATSTLESARLAGPSGFGSQARTAAYTRATSK